MGRRALRTDLRPPRWLPWVHLAFVYTPAACYPWIPCGVCIGGCSPAAAMAACFLMQSDGFSAEKALEHLRQCFGDKSIDSSVEDYSYDFCARSAPYFAAYQKHLAAQGIAP